MQQQSYHITKPSKIISKKIKYPPSRSSKCQKLYRQQTRSIKTSTSTTNLSIKTVRKTKTKNVEYVQSCSLKNDDQGGGPLAFWVSTHDWKLANLQKGDTIIALWSPLYSFLRLLLLHPTRIYDLILYRIYVLTCCLVIISYIRGTISLFTGLKNFKICKNKMKIKKIQKKCD